MQLTGQYQISVCDYVLENLDYLFISVQAMDSLEVYKNLPSEYYDYIVMDVYEIIGQVKRSPILKAY